MSGEEKLPVHVADDLRLENEKEFSGRFLVEQFGIRMGKMVGI